VPFQSRKLIVELISLNKIKHFIQKYAAWIQHVLAPLGPWGMLAFAAVDGSFLGMPLDAIFVSYVYNDRARFLLYVLLGAVGSAVGSIVIYLIGYTGGEVLLRKRLSAQRFEKIHASFEKHQFWALMFPAMLPPPTPFKAVVLAAAAFEMNFWHFLLAIFAGRFVRFFLEALLTLWFGPRIVAMTRTFFTHHFLFIASIAAELLAAWIIWRFLKQRGKKKKGAAEDMNSALRGEERESAS
jgi:membrane protein YqaA with SNARE-associated domain